MILADKLLSRRIHPIEALAFCRHNSLFWFVFFFLLCIYVVVGVVVVVVWYMCVCVLCWLVLHYIGTVVYHHIISLVFLYPVCVFS